MKPRAPRARCRRCERVAAFRVLWADGRAKVFACELHIERARKLDEVVRVEEVRP